MKSAKRLTWPAAAMILAGAATMSGCAGSFIPADSHSRDADIRFLQEALIHARAKHNLPALAGSIIRSGGEPAGAASGVRRIDQTPIVTLVDRFSIRSCAKSMTGTLIGILVKQGKISYDARLNSLLPEAAPSMNPAYQGVTLEQVMSMKAGLPGYTTPEEIATLPIFPGTPAEQRAKLSQYILSAPPAYTPGATHYSNTPYVLAAAIAERATGKTWQELMQQYVFGPLTMSGVGYGAPAKTDSLRQPWGHIPSGSGWKAISPQEESDLPALYPAGDLNMTISDWGRFVRAHLRGLEGKETSFALSSQDVKREHLGSIGEITIGGWQRLVYNGHEASFFEGSTGTFDAVVLIRPDKDLAIVLVTNASDEDSDRNDTGDAMREVIDDVLKRG